MSEYTGLRGGAWFHALTANVSTASASPASVLCADALLGPEQARFLCVAPNPHARFPCARHGEVGLDEAFALARATNEVIEADQHRRKRPIVAIVDVKSQAYGRREETAGIFLAAATAAEAYARARFAGHPVISLVVGHAFSGGFLTHGYQANRILAFDDPNVTIHAMHKEAAARITRRSVDDLLRLAQSLPPLSYDVRGFAKLGLLHELLSITDPDQPSPQTTSQVQQALLSAINDARSKPCDLSNRLESAEALALRKATIETRRIMKQQWNATEVAS